MQGCGVFGDGPAVACSRQARPGQPAACARRGIADDVACSDKKNEPALCGRRLASWRRNGIRSPFRRQSVAVNFSMPYGEQASATSVPARRAPFRAIQRRARRASCESAVPPFAGCTTRAPSWDGDGGRCCSNPARRRRRSTRDLLRTAFDALWRRAAAAEAIQVRRAVAIAPVECAARPGFALLLDVALACLAKTGLAAATRFAATVLSMCSHLLERADAAADALELGQLRARCGLLSMQRCATAHACRYGKRDEDHGRDIHRVPPTSRTMRQDTASRRTDPRGTAGAARIVGL